MGSTQTEKNHCLACLLGQQRNPPCVGHRSPVETAGGIVAAERGFMAIDPKRVSPLIGTCKVPGSQEGICLGGL